ncbi:multinuclear nonheme iron-dependent oxidase [Streptomyces syringium]|uniref:multinuclear nonheme iron-dependent oxidase n=1 Tax=Streptomyces syringium TaxID=76729 RepID=UPI0034526516
MRTVSEAAPPGARPLVGFSWDMTSEHERLAPFAERLAGEDRAFMVGPYARDAATVDEAVRFCEQHALVPLLHTLDLDLCGLDPVDDELVKQLGDAVRRLGVSWVTTDLAMWTKDGESLVEALVPMPWIEDSVDYVVPRVERMQELLGVRVAVENSAYAYVVGDANPFALQSEIARRADAFMVYDVGHHLIASEVSGIATDALMPEDFAWDRVVEGHLSGVTVLAADDGVTADDQHAAPIREELWLLARRHLPAATGLRAMVAESEGIRGEDLVAKVGRMAAEVRIWRGEDR